MWECGLKLVFPYYNTSSKSSLLMWECGLKQHFSCYIGVTDLVTPYVGVWIETT